MQAQLSRRKVITSAALLAGYPAAGAIASVTGAGAGATASLPITRTAVPSHSSDLAQWTNSTLAPVARSVRSGSLRPHHLRAASSSVRAYARHLEDIGIDQYANVIAAEMTKRATTPDPETVRAAHERLSRFDRSLPYEEIERAHTVAPAHLNHAIRSVQEHGYSWHFHWAADRLHLAGDVLELQLNPHLANLASPAHVHGTLSDGVYHAGQGAHLVLENGRICRFMRNRLKWIPQNVKDELCGDLTDAGIIQGIVALGSTAICAATYGISIVATDGAVLAVVSPSAAVGICAVFDALTGVATTVAIAAASCALAC